MVSSTAGTPTARGARSVRDSQTLLTHAHKYSALLLLWLSVCSSACGGRTLGVHDAGVQADSTMDAIADAQDQPFCGDGNRDLSEACDGTDLDGVNCTSLGYQGGELKCTPTCSFDESGCFLCGDGQCALAENHALCPVDCMGVLQVAGSLFHSCARLTTGDVWCWGMNDYGQLGVGYTSENEPTPLAASVDGVAALSTFGSHSCALASNGGLSCWGTNFAGELGPGATDPYSATPVSVPGLDQMVEISAGCSFTCAVVADGTVLCFGSNQSGQLGGGTLGGSSASPIAVIGLSASVSVSAGGSHACALSDGGMISCWGSNSRLQLGNSSVGFSTTPLVVAFGGSASQVSAGESHTCVVDETGEVYCWGSNSRGQLGDGSWTDTAIPVAVLGLEGVEVVSMEAGADHTCVTTTEGEVYCWGSNDEGQLGDISQLDRPSAVAVAGLSNALGVSAASTHSCAWLADFTAYCWGSNWGKLGDGSTSERSLTPVRVSGL